MTSKQQQEELFRHIWRITNQVRGAVEAKGYFIAPSQTMVGSLTCGSSRTSTPAIRKPLRSSRTGTI